jgi:hypothetical protein
MFLIGQAHAKTNGRDVIEPPDLPITKELQESIREFRELDHDIEGEQVLEQSVSENMWQLQPELAGKTVHTTQWDRAFRISDLLLGDVQF